jgi:hypothetical protein
VFEGNDYGKERRTLRESRSHGVSEFQEEEKNNKSRRENVRKHQEGVRNQRDLVVGCFQRVEEAIKMCRVITLDLMRRRKTRVK